MGFSITHSPIEPPSEPPSEQSGAVVTFEGRVRVKNAGRRVLRLDYTAYETLAVKEGELIVREAHSRAEKEAEGLQDRIQNLQADIATLELQRTNFLVRLRAVVRSQSDLIEAMELEASLGKPHTDRNL